MISSQQYEILVCKQISNPIQVLKGSDGRLLLIDLTEGKELGAGAAAAAEARAFVAEVCSFIDADSPAAQTRAAEALRDVLRDARRDGGAVVHPALAAALAEVRGVEIWFVVG